MSHVLETAWKKLRRDVERGDTLAHLAARSARYALGLVSARVYLLGVDEVGDGVRTEGRPRVVNHGFMRIGRDTLLRSVMVPVELATEPRARLELGAGCSLNYGVSIGCVDRVTLGDRCRLGPYVMIVDSHFHDFYERTRRPAPRPVRLEDDVWVGAKASILPGVTVGRGAVIGTGSVVTKDVPPFSIVAGAPARVLKQLDAGRFGAARAHA